jgi:formylmethanofuran dehydrogenase subunit E
MPIRDEAILLWQKRKEEIKKEAVEELRRILGDQVSFQILDNDSPLLNLPDEDSIYVYVIDGDTNFLVEAVYNPRDKKTYYHLIARCSECKEVFACDDYEGVVGFNDLEMFGRALEVLSEARPVCSRCYNHA